MSRREAEPPVGCASLTLLCSLIPLIVSSQVRTLVVFYTGKLDDTETIIPALKGLVTLTKFPAFTSTDAVEVVKA